MALTSYDITSPESLLEFARGLSGKTLSEVIDMRKIAENISNKGDLGNMVEKYYYQYQPDNTSHKPDFPEAGVELKTTGVLKRSDGSYKAKERLVLTMINYMNLIEERWDNSSLMEKCRMMLILFYLYEKGVAVFDRRFVLHPLLFKFPTDDLAIIRRDWETIQGKIKDGKAHELSEGDTYYLGACRKGSGGENETLKKQPFSDVLAKSRAFSLKPSYVNKIIQGHTSEVGALDITDELTIEEATQNKFKPYLGKTIDEISDMLDFHKQGKNHKGFYRSLTMRILGGSKRSIPELDKAGVELKTIRVNKDWMPAEAMSFPTFKYMDIIEEEWEESSFFRKIEQKFLFVIFREDQKSDLRLEKVMYWNMPYADRVEAYRVWEDTKKRVAIDASDLPKSSESHVAHVRPKAKNAQDTLPTPQGTELVKKCFWLNRKYISRVIQTVF
jgi:DNA mismatch repair protein MutH